MRLSAISTTGIAWYSITVGSSQPDFRDKKVTPGVIAKNVLREPHAVSKILTRMEKDGLVKKINGVGRKKNEVLVSLTEKGRTAYKHSIKRDSIHDIMSCLSEKECIQLCSLLDKLRDKALQELTETRKANFS